ncbi:MAG: hypothetical protein EXS37_22185 [Opitutus sp.]|nr:hypothetical protein [Opitutus sp.]
MSVCILVLVACSSGPAITPKGTVKVVLDAEKKSTALAVKTHNLIAITFPPAAAGFGWQISYHDSRYLKQMTDIKPATVAGEGATISFLALNIGRSRLRFLLAPLGTDRESKPIDQQELVLTMQ